MACKYFAAGRLPRCAAVRGLIVPSAFEREKFCGSGSFGECLVYQAFQQNGGQIKEADFYALPFDQIFAPKR